MESETVYHSYGCSHSGTVAGVTFTEEYKKVVTNISGYYYYESGVRLGLMERLDYTVKYADRSWRDHEMV